MKGRWIFLSVIMALSIAILWRINEEFDALAKPLDFPIIQKDSPDFELLGQSGGYATTPLSSISLAVYQTIQNPTDLSFQGTEAYIVRGYWQRVEKWDLSNPGAPRLLGGSTSPGGYAPLKVISVNNTAYIGTGNGIVVMDFTNPQIPIVADTYYTTYAVPHISISGKYLYAWEMDMRQVLIFDTSTPNKLNLLGTFNLSINAGYYTDFFASGTTLFLLNNNILLVLDVSNPAAVKQISSLDFSSFHPYPTTIHPTALDIQGNTLYVVSYVGDGGGVPNYHGDLWVFNVTNPVQIALEKEYPLPACCQLDIAVEVAKAYVAGNTGMWAIDVSDPANPQVAGPIRSGWSGFQKVFVNDRQVYLLVGNDEWNMNMFILEYPGLSVSGSILQPNGIPFPGPGISVSVSSTIATGPHADYFINYLPPGTYPVSASWIGVRFFPALYTLTLPPDQTQVNFTILPLPVSVNFNPGVDTSLGYVDTQSLPTNIGLPANALTSTTTLTMTPTIANPPFGFAFTGHAFDIGGTRVAGGLPDLRFTQPITATIYYSDYDVRLALAENELALNWWDGSQWVDAGQTCQPATTSSQDLDHHFISVPICRGGRFALFATSLQISLPVVVRK